jgi:hypothetical protein
MKTKKPTQAAAKATRPDAPRPSPREEAGSAEGLHLHAALLWPAGG